MNNDKVDLIFGRNPVREALRAKRTKRIFITPNFSHKEILELISENAIPKVIRNVKELDALSGGGVHQGIVAEIKPYEYFSLEYLLAQAKTVSRPIIVVLDGSKEIDKEDEKENEEEIEKESCDSFSKGRLKMKICHII